MTRKLTLAAAIILITTLQLQAQTSGLKLAHPHHTRVVNGVTKQESPADYPLNRFETAPSLACIYGLVSTIVPGCPVNGTTALPAGGSGIIAVVNAYDYPTAAHDLNVFSRRFGLPTCDSSNPCFAKVFATGFKPRLDALWSSNAAGVIEYAHAFAPSATIILVEAASGTIDDLNIAVERANNIIATRSPTGRGQIILPYGGDESADQLANDALFTTPGVIYISGNESSPVFPLEYPATSPNVLALGGNGVKRDPQGMFLGEFASHFWAGGLSAFEKRPSYQDSIQDIVRGHRGIPDVSFAADPIAGASLYYDSTDLDGFVGWLFTGYIGFGEGAWAAIINRADTQADNTPDELTTLYNNLGNPDAFRDITQGQSFGIHAVEGWDPLTGIGVPVGLVGK
jgi:subtilase family serine protease